jgi:DNA-binding transcriptional LysR family regulator
METRYLKTLVVAVESGSFSKAADILHLTQSAVSQRVKFLEERYGHQLLDRSGQSLVPTEVGQVVLEKARSVLEKENELLEGLKRFDGEKRLSLCCTPTFGTAYLPKILNEFIQHHTDVEDLKFIFHQPEPALHRLAKGEFDLAVIEHCEGVDLAAFATYALPRDELVFISSAKLDLQPVLELESLLGYRLYARKDGCSSKQLLKQNMAALEKNLTDFAGVVTSDDLRWTVDNVVNGNGISFLSRCLVEKELAEGTLTASFVGGFNHQRCRTVAFLPNRTSELAVRNFLDCLFGAFDQEVERLQSTCPAP